MRSFVRGLALVILLASVAAAQTWNAARDFSGQQNPNGQWAYGWKSSATGALTVFPTYQPSIATLPGRDAWQDLNLNALLGVYHNTVGVAGDIPTDMLMLQPGSASQLAAVEWVAPAAMSVHVQGIFQTLDTAAAQVNVVSSVSGIRYSGAVNGTTTTGAFGLFLNVAAGEKLDFVAAGGGVGVHVVISKMSLVPAAILASPSLTDTRLRLTGTFNFSAGGGWAISKQRFADGFDASFLFMISNLTGSGADGFAFVIQNSSATALGGNGGNLGYGGIADSLAVEFDAFQNTDPGWNDPNDNHISVHTGGTGVNGPQESFSLGTNTAIPNMSDSQWHLVHINYVVQPQPLLSIYMDNMTTPVLQVPVDIVSKLQLPDGTAWIGFTGATGGIAETHEIQNWHFLSFDIHPPVLTLPANMVMEANAAGGAVANFSVSALDAVDGSRPVTCSPVSGSLFAVGVTTVNCSSTDLSGNTGTGSFTVTVTDTTAPNLTVPLAVSADAVNSSGAAVSFIATADDIVDGAIVPVCVPASGSVFPLGKTTVTCTATDHAGNSAGKQFVVEVADHTAPVISGAGDIALEATAAMTVVSWPSVTASDNVDGNVPVLCTPASGSQFAIGKTSVQCAATDAAGNQAAASFAVTVRDTTPPTITGMPADMTVEATSSSGAVASWPSPSATDLVDGAVAVNCAPASGSTFAFGQATVTCSATDARSNTSSKSFKVTVQDTTAPLLTGMPSSMTLEATSAAGAVASWPAPTATDSVDGALAVTCAPASGSAFALGSTSVSCSATDAHGNKASASFSVTVKDTTPPVISNMPANMTLTATSASGAVATWPAPTANDLVSGSVAVACAPASGSLFPLGATAVSCSATDARGNTSTAGFTVTVQDGVPPQISCAAPDGLWHATDVALACTARDTGSGLANAADASFTLVTSVPAGAETANAATNSRVVCDQVGNCAIAGPIFGNMVDKRGPAISITSPANTTYSLNQSVSASYACADSGSGLQACSATVANGAAVDTSSSGAKTFTVTARDNAGNISTATVTYTVSYNPAYRLCAGGDSDEDGDGTLPLRAGICDLSGNNRSSLRLGLVALGLMGPNGQWMRLDDAGHANPGMRFRYIGSRNGGAYLFNLRVRGFAPGLYRLLVKVGDEPLPQTITFQIRRHRK